MLAIAILLAIVSVLLALPSVQTKLGKRATNYLQKEFDVAINVSRVDLSFLGNIQLKEILIQNHHNDTLIYVDNLTTSIASYKKIIDNKLNFGQISLSDFVLNLKTYKGESDDALTVFVDKLDGEPTPKPSGFLLTASRLKLKKGAVFIEDQNKPNEKMLSYKNIYGGAKNFKIDGPNVFANIEGLSCKENHTIEVENLTTDFTYTKSYMKFLNTKLETANSKLNADINFTYNREDFSDFNNKVFIEATVSHGEISLLDLNKMYAELKSDDVVHFSTNIKGTLNDFTAIGLQLESDDKAVINGDINFKNVFDLEKGFVLDGNIEKLATDYTHLKTILPNVLGKILPSSFKKLGYFSLNGNTYITKNLINTSVTLNTDIGTTYADLELTNFENIDKASYKGHIKVEDLKFGEVVGDPLIGLLSMEADVDGEGFTLENMNSSVKGTVSKHQYKGYSYSNISLNGIVKNKHFNGEMEVNDTNIKLNFNGLANFSSTPYSFDFNAIVDYCDLNKLNLFTRDSISNIKGDLEINVKGYSLDDLVGSVKFKNSLYTNQKDNYFFKDFNISSSFTDSVRTITINSPEIITGRLRGTFKFNEIGKLTKNAIGSLYSNYKPFEVSKKQQLDFRFNIYNKIVEVFYPEVTLSANTFIRGDLNSDENLFKLQIKSPKVIAFKNIIDKLNLQIDNRNPLFNTQLTVNKVYSNVYDISKLKLVNITLNDTLYFRTEFKGGKHNSEDFGLSFYHTFNKENKSVFGMQKSNITYKNKTWTINPKGNLSSNIIYDNKTKGYVINPFEITSENQKISFSGEIKDSISKNINFNFKDVKLANITPKIDSLNLEGIINGSLNYNQIQKQIKPTANITISNFNINKSHQGDLKIAIEGKNSVKKYGIQASLNRDKKISFSAIGEFNFSNQQPTLDVILDFEEFKLDAFSPLGEDVFTNIRGYAYGNVNLTGLLSNPVMNGDLYLDQAGLYFPYLNVDYDFEGTSIVTLQNQTFTFDDVTLRDRAKNTKGNLKGILNHKKFKYWDLNLDISTNNLLVLNTKEKENSLYYGTGFLSGNATIKGPTDKLVIDVIGKTNKGTYFVIPISDVKTVESSELIRFVNKLEIDENEELRKAFISDKLKGLSLNFNLDVTKDAVVEMVLDKATGSFLKGSGTGNLQIELDTKDKFNMYGDFLVDNGIYNFKYGGFINKPFSVNKGGSISWSGDPFTANIDIEAVYEVSANPKSLLENITANRKIPVDLITRFSGELFNSQREFDIEIPNSSSNVASELAFKLNNNDKNTKTVHFISLLVSGTFYNENDISVTSNAALYGTGFDLLSNAFDNIFNQGNNRFKLKPVYTVGEKNKVDNLTIDDELAIALDYQVNDRILINGKVGMPIGSKEQSNVVGEVNIEFLMNEEGTLRSSVFNRQNEIQYTEEEEGYTQGVGLSYQIDFDNGKELLQKLGLKKKIKDTVQNVNKKDSVLISNKLINFKNKKKNNE